MRNCRVKEQKEVATLQFSNKFEVLRSRVMNVGEGSRGEEIRDRKIMLREERKKESSRSKKIRGRERIVKRSDGENWVGKD